MIITKISNLTRVYSVTSNMEVSQFGIISLKRCKNLKLKLSK